VERYIPGAEVAVEGLLTRGKLRILAVFDKPDPLEGPYFEETLYVTPSRLPDDIYDRLLDCADRTVQALGLTHGPVHAEFRINDDGPWVLEAAPRPIGGLCSRALRFGPQACLAGRAAGAARAGPARNGPGPRRRRIRRDDDSRAQDRRAGKSRRAKTKPRKTPGIEDVQITARLHDFIAAWPDGATYLGFLFARGKLPAEVEAALRLAHSHLKFEITERLPVQHPVTGTVQSTS
jgi:hypothetical protein